MHFTILFRKKQSYIRVISILNTKEVTLTAIIINTPMTPSYDNANFGAYVHAHDKNKYKKILHSKEVTGVVSFHTSKNYYTLLQLIMIIQCNSWHS